MNVVYLTNGISRTINLGEGKAINFKHSSPRYFAMRNQLALLLTIALKDWKVENLSTEQIEVIKSKLNASPRLQIVDVGFQSFITLEAQPNGEGDNTYPEPRQVYFHYKSVFTETLNYLRPDIILEVSARSLKTLPSLP